MKSAIVIPAFRPGPELHSLTTTLQHIAPDTPLIIVDDGSGSSFSAIFSSTRQRGAIVLSHPENRGKGAALKTAFRYWLDHAGGDQLGVVTADADGQHHPEDIRTLIAAQEESPQALHLGTRQFSLGSIPWRSKLGNTLSAFLFHLFTGQRIADTQTGLRAVSRELMEELSGSTKNGYEFEMEMILTACRLGLAIQQHPIRAIYLPGNPTSHFHPIVDSYRVYRVLFEIFFSRSSR